MRKAGKRPDHELADIINKYGPAYIKKYKVPGHHLKTLSAIQSCRTAKLGGHINVCKECAASSIGYNSCRNRHCPKCGGMERELWIEDRKNELLQVPYQHVVFTIPHELSDIVRYNERFCYNLLFQSAWKTLDTFGGDERWLGARIGATMVLHTWGQNLSFHPHLHCIVPTGGLDGDVWKYPRKGSKGARPQVQGKAQKGRFLFPVKALATVFRGIFLTRLRAAWLAGALALPPTMPVKPKSVHTWCRKRWRQTWIVYAKTPFGGPDAVVEYLGRYTHKTAISNHRLLNVGPDKVTFHYKDYRDGGKRKMMQLAGTEFLRRFCQHILPSGFVRIRSYGILSNVLKAKALTAARLALHMPEPPPGLKPERAERRRRLIEILLGHGIDDCPDCGAKDSLVRILIPPTARAPPTIPFNTAGI